MSIEACEHLDVGLPASGNQKIIFCCLRPLDPDCSML